MKDTAFGNFLRSLREAQGWTQRQLGEQLGVTDKAVSKWENGGAKPHSDLLFRLGELFHLSTDELLLGRRQDAAPPAADIALSHQALWDAAYEKLAERYGKTPPAEVLDRFESERAELGHTDMILYLHALAAVAEAARRHRTYMHARGTVATSFVAYVLGATHANPLPPHYRCPVCRRTWFSAAAEDGWDLPPAHCTCGCEAERDGHRIPFESYRAVAQRYRSFELAVSAQFLPVARECLNRFFSAFPTAALFDDGRTPLYALVVLPAHLAHTYGTEPLPYNVYGEELMEYPHVTLTCWEVAQRCEKMAQMTNTCPDRIPFLTPDAHAAFATGDVAGIPEFDTPFMHEMLTELQPRSLADVIRAGSLAHGTGTWLGNGQELIRQGCRPRDLITCRDDVFLYIKEKAAEAGLTAGDGIAYAIMHKARMGKFCNKPIDEATRALFDRIGASHRFVTSLQRIRYLFPKSHAVTYVRLALILMWYKKHYPAEFEQIFLPKS